MVGPPGSPGQRADRESQPADSDRTQQGSVGLNSMLFTTSHRQLQRAEFDQIAVRRQSVAAILQKHLAAARYGVAGDMDPAGRLEAADQSLGEDTSTGELGDVV